ncbi:MAG: MATE family efflux transporter [Ruthenibacterium lactatiformans]
MDLLKGNVRQIYFRYLGAAFGSALISSIYGLVDSAMVGQYQGPEGTAALAIVAPVWNIIYSLGLLTGIGGSVLLSAARGAGRQKEGNEYFTAALAGTVFFAAVSWLAIAFFDAPLLRLFGARDALLPLAQQYLLPSNSWCRCSCSTRCWRRSAQRRRAGACHGGGAGGRRLQCVRRLLFVFTCDMGVFGAGLATAIGSGITFTVMLSHFSRRCTLRPVRFRNAGTKLRQILTTGFSTFFLDIAMGILTMLFNRQILQGLGTDALAVYGVIVNVSTMVQCCAYSVGQAAQPILSACFGAGKWGRIRAALKYALMAAAFFSAVWTLLVFLFPNGFIRIFMSPTGDILRIAPAILRGYGVFFLLLPLNIFSTYYFQSLMKPRASFSVSVLRGLVLSGALIYALPALLGPGAVWFAMPVTEAVTAVGVCVLIVRYTRPAPQTPE